MAAVASLVVWLVLASVAGAVADALTAGVLTGGVLMLVFINAAGLDSGEVEVVVSPSIGLLASSSSVAVMSEPA